MTTYRYRIDFNDSDMGMLYFALGLTIMHCLEKMDNGERDPYYKYITEAEAIRKRLYNDVKQTSGGDSLGIWIDLTS